MYLEVYPDIVFILNFFIDFILLFLLKRVNRKNSNMIRMIGAAALGAMFAVLVSIFPSMNIVIRFVIMNVISLITMILLAFGRMKKTDLLKQMIALYLITYFAGGLINSIYYHTNFRLYLIHITSSLTLSNISWAFILVIMLLLVPVSILLLWLLRWYRSNEHETYEVELYFNGCSIHTTGLLDSGNCLYDPFFKKPVMVMETSLLRDFIPVELIKDMEKANLCLQDNIAVNDCWGNESEYINRLRFIPFQSVGKEQGIMPGLLLDKVLIHTGKETICNEKVTAAICDNHLSAKDDYHVILHKGLL